MSGVPPATRPGAPIRASGPIRTRRRLEVEGLVQGVGFRAFVHRLATAHALTGFVRSRGALLEIEVQGARDAAEAFTAALGGELPGGARIDALRATLRPPGLEREFRIVESALESAGSQIPPDWPMCPECVREMLEPGQRRHRYPFTHCGSCGPRASVLLDLPYDRERTSMLKFAPCAACEAEYQDPRNRRFHAQNIACPTCGPRLRLVVVPDRAAELGRVRHGDDPLRGAVGLLKRGAILAVKGYGGFQLVADATRPEVVERLRQRKQRPAEPFPVLVADLRRARALVELGDHGAALESAMRPVVLLPACTPSLLAPGVAPGLGEIGVMLPSTPLQVLLLAESGVLALVSTTADRPGEPVVTDDREAIARLGGVADAFLVHDRPITRRNHDSVLRPIAGALRPLRLSRGSAPLSLAMAEGPTVLAIGGDLQNAPALSGRGRVHLLPHVGDLRHPDALDELVATVTHHARLLDLWPDLVAHDLEPDCASTRVAEALGLPSVGVQHQHAHLAACLTELEVTGPVLGLVMDGTGWGTDGTTWGGEILLGDVRDVRRLARLSPLAMPGGHEVAAREPWRLAVAALESAFPGEPIPRELAFARSVDPERLAAVRELARRGGATAPRTASCGRLFDAVAALLGLFTERTYEGQGAALLEALARSAGPGQAALGVPGGPRRDPESPDRDETSARLIPSAIVDTSRLIRAVVDDLRALRDPAHTALAFHLGLADQLALATARLSRWTGVTQVAFTGGCAVNGILVESLRNRLAVRGLEMLLAERVPASDAGLAVGQAAVASARLAAHSGEDLRGSRVT